MPKLAAKPPAADMSDTAIFLKSLQDPDIIERVRVTIKNAHVFKLPPRQTVSVGWRGADWKEKVWQGTVKVVERGDITAVLLVDKVKGSIFAVCPVKEGAVDRCVDSSRYFVLRIENATGRHMFIGVAFNERNDAFDFNTALEDSRREREAELQPVQPYAGPTKDYSIKEGEKIHVAVPKVAGGGGKEDGNHDNDTSSFLDLFGESSGGAGAKTSVAARRRADRKSKPMGGAGGLLAPSAKDTPSRSGPTASHSTEKANAQVTAVGGAQKSPADKSDVFSNGFGESDPFNIASPTKNDDPFTSFHRR